MSSSRMARDTGAARHLACHDDLLQTGAAKAADGIVNDFVVFQKELPWPLSRATYTLRGDRCQIPAFRRYFSRYLGKCRVSIPQRLTGPGAIGRDNTL